jgi:predicted MPP superfamily phosphohydrolase
MKTKNKMNKMVLALLLILGFPSYVGWDNNRVVVDDVTLSHAELPVSFDGYKILQISDLHEKTFGPEQKKLVNLIKKQEYDLVLFTGDYIADGRGDLKPLKDLLKGMPNDREMYYILGHTDVNNSITSLVAGNRFFDLFEKYGVKPLYPGQKITINGESIWLKTNPYVGINEIVDGSPSQQMIDAKKAFDQLYNNASDPFTIEVSHRPTEIDHEDDLLHDYRTTTLGETDEEWIDWHLSINGFTHGGQYYLPIIGPLYAPGYGFFPGKVNVRGVHTVNGHTQYVSPGLGASGPAFAKFRLFNTPSIGLITLKKS